MEYPNAEGNLDEAGARVALAQWGLEAETLVPCGTAKHVFTHIEWQMKGYLTNVSGEGPADFRWVDAHEFETLAIPSAFRHFTALARDALEGRKNGC